MKVNSKTNDKAIINSNSQINLRTLNNNSKITGELINNGIR